MIKENLNGMIIKWKNYKGHYFQDIKMILVNLLFLLEEFIKIMEKWTTT